MAHNGATAQANEQLAPGGFHRFRPVSDAEEGPNVESNLVRPATDAIITVRIIKSFAFRSMKALVLKNVDLTTTTVDALKEMCKLQVRTSASFKPFRTWADKFGEYGKQGELYESYHDSYHPLFPPHALPFSLPDTLKIYTRAHGAKTTNLIINLDHPEWVLEAGEKTLFELGLENEAELSLFHRPDYEAFLKDPETRW